MPDRTFPCENCGAQLSFAPGQASLACPNCGHVQAIPEADEGERVEALTEIDFAGTLARLARGAEVEQVRVVPCPSCGARNEFPPGTDATRCPFCGTPLVSQGEVERLIRPTALIPFQLTEDAARDAMSSWLGSLWFAPNGLQEYARKGRRLDGTYVPYWTFDADTRTTYRGRRGDHYYVTRTVMRDGKPTTVREQRTRWRSVSGAVARDFDDVLVLASRSLPKDYTDALEPWDLSALEPHRADYLAGFKAEAYQVQLDEGFGEARAIMDAQIDRDIRGDIGGDVQQITAKHPEISDVTFKHVLLPVWMAAYRYGGRSFRFVVNGQTGKVRGERPWSRWKIAFAVIAALILALVLAYVYAAYQEGGLPSPGSVLPGGDGPSWLNE